MSCLPHLNALWQNGDAGWGGRSIGLRTRVMISDFIWRVNKKVTNRRSWASEVEEMRRDARVGEVGEGGGANGNLFWCIDIDFVLCPREEERDTNWQNKSKHSCPNKGRWSLILPYFYFTIFALLFIVLCIVYKHIYEIHWFINHFLSWSLWRREIVGCSLG